MTENTAIVLETLTQVYPEALTRPQLADRTGIPRTTIYDALMRLVRSGVITRYPEKRTTRGTPKIYYEAVPTTDPAFENLCPMPLDPAPSICLWFAPTRVFAIGFKSDLPIVLERLVPVFNYSGPCMWEIPEIDFLVEYIQWIEDIITAIDWTGKFYLWHSGYLICEGTNFFAILAPKVTEETS